MKAKVWRTRFLGVGNGGVFLVFFEQCALFFYLRICVFAEIHTTITDIIK